MTFKNSPLEQTISTLGHPWNQNEKVIHIFETDYSILDFLSLLDSSRLELQSQKSPISDKAERLFYTFSGLFFLLKEVHAVEELGLSSSSNINIGNLKRQYTSCCEYITIFIQLLEVVEARIWLNSMEYQSLKDMENDYMKGLIENKQMVALIEAVRDDFVSVRFLLMVLRSEGLDIIATRIQRNLGISVD